MDTTANQINSVEANIESIFHNKEFKDGNVKYREKKKLKYIGGGRIFNVYQIGVREGLTENRREEMIKELRKGNFP